MKKLLFILSAIFVSVMGWAQLNPYAYGLSSSWNNATKKLTVTYSLNSAAYNDGAGGDPDGVQIHLTDDKNDPKKYYIYGVPAANIGKGKQTFTIDLSSGLDRYGKTIPENKNLYVAITVQGNRKISKPYMYSPGNNANNEFKVYSPHGIAVDKDPNSPNFGNIYVNEGWQETKTGFNTGKAGMYVIDATFDKFNTTRYTGNYDFSQYVIENTYDGLARKGYQPWRVRVSDDGRIFVCSNDMHQRQATNAAGERDGVAVWEVDRNNFNNWTPILHGYRRFVSGQTGTNYTFSYKDVNGVEQFIGPICGMDVKGTGNDVTLLLYTVNQAGVWLNMNGFRAYEYNVKSKTLKPISAFNKGTYGYIFEQVTLRYGVDGSYWFGASRADGSDGDKTNGKTKEPNLGHVKLDGATADYTNYNAEFYAGAGLINYKSTYNNETINGANHSWLIAGKDNNGNDNGLFDVFLVTSSADGGASVTRIDGNGGRPNWQGISVKNTGRNLNDFAIDYAENLYIAGNGGNGGRVCAFAMPYGGEKTTIAREQYAFKYQNPVPNILATDLRFAPDGNSDRYVFSFNVNTTPKVAQIRFYKSYGDNGENDMKKNLAKINADDYQGGNAITPSFVYDIPADQLKQGKISVSLGMCGGIIEGGKITNNKLPRGEWYWSVYVEASRKSSVFAPIYEQGTTGEDAHYRLHATVNNYPETDGFGHIYAVNYYAEFDAKNGLMDYSFNPNGASNDEQNNIKNSNRYKLVKNYLNPTGEKPKFTNQRRLAVAPDGKVYIADAGSSLAFDANAPRPWMFTGGGVFVWNPNTQTPTSNEIQISLFSNKDLSGTATGVDIYNHNGQLKLYATNTYGEFDNHYNGGKKWKGYEYTEANQADVNIYGWNGFKEYILGTPENILLQETNGTAQRSLGMGDGNGHISLVATEKGVWLAQHRLNDVQYTIDVFKANNSKKPALPDNTENYVLSFVPYGSNTRTWSSCTSRGINYSGSTYDQTDASELTQLTSSPLQSCPGAGLAYRKTNGKEYLYIVNHQGNIVELQITSWLSTTPTVKYIKTYPGSGPKGLNDGNRTQGAINSMCFDYAGNLITTSGEKYIGATQNILVYTMPYDRVNAREIQAPNSCRYIPERVSHLNMGDEELSNIISGNQGNTCHVDIFRPMFNTSFSTICLPFDVDLSQASANEYKDAKLMKFAEAVITDINKEKMLELRFTEITDGKLKAGIPYLIQPQEPITQIVHLAQLVSFKSITPEDQKLNFTDGDQNNSITFKGIIPYQQIEVDPNKPWPLIVVDNNRLAEVSTTGYINGFRAYFQLENELAPGTKMGISARKPTPTNIITIDGKRVNIEKFLREGRVYIRVGDSLYTITGEKVE